VQQFHEAGHDPLDLYGGEVGQRQTGDDHVVAFVGVELLDVRLVHVCLQRPALRGRVGGDEVTQPRGEARVGLDDVEAASSRQLG
jgi:hypothetical protein